MAVDWDKLRLFHAVVEAGSLTEAGRKLGMSQPALSRQIRSLEEQTGSALFHRHARGIVLTHDGERLAAATKGFADRIEAATREIAESGQYARGPLNVTTTVSFGSLWIVPHLPRFFSHYPEMKINLVLSDSELDLATRQAEVAIRFQAPSQADLIQRPLVKVQHNLYASKRYVEAHGVPKTVEDLDNHPLITYGQDVPLPIQDVNWILTAGAEEGLREPVLTVNNIYGVAQAVRKNIGIAALPDYLARHEEDLVRVLPDVQGPTFQTYFVYPSELKGSRRVQVFRDFLFEEVSNFEAEP